MSGPNPTTAFDTKRYGPQEQAPVARKTFDPALRAYGPICDGIATAAMCLREQLIEPTEIHMTRKVHDALVAELGMPKGHGVTLSEFHGIRIVVVN